MPKPRTLRCLPIASVLLAVVLVATLALPAAASTDDDQQIADSSTLTIDDIDAVVGQGFTEQAPDDGEQDFDAPSCASIRKVSKLIKRGPSAETEFGAEAGDAFSNINNIVGVLANAKRAKVAYAAYAGPKAADCLEEAFTEAIEAQDPNASPSVTVERSTPDAGDASVGYEGAVSAGGDGFFFEIVFVRVGRALSGFYFVNSSGAPPPDDTAQLVEDGVDRLAENLAA